MALEDPGLALADAEPLGGIGDFNGGTLVEGSNALQGIADAAIHGANGYRATFNSATADNDAACGFLDPGSAQVEIYARKTFEIPAFSYPFSGSGPLQELAIVTILDSDFGVEAYVRYRASSVNRYIYDCLYWDGSAWQAIGTALSISGGTTYTVELRWLRSTGATDGAVQFWVDGTSRGSASHNNTALTGYVSFGPLFGGIPADGEYLDFDDCKLSTTQIGYWAGEKTVSDDVGVTDAVATAVGRYRTLTDNVGVADLLTTARGLVQAIGDAIGITDALTEARGLFCTLAESVGITGALATARTITRTIADTVGITDLFTRVLTLMRTIADGVGIADLVAVGGEPPETASEHVTFVTTSESFVSTVITESSFDSTVTAESNHLSEV